MTDDLRLLHEYVRQNSREALDELIRRHLDLVYSAARRQVRDPHLAEDVTQAVFLVLAKKAGAIQRGVAVAGWLLAVTRCTSLDAMRKQAIRQKHERAAASAGEKEVAADEWAEIAPLLDGELNRLGTRDRDAVVLRFFQNRSFAEIGAELELSPDAARKRVERAIVRLRGLLARRGVTFPAVAIGGAIAAFAVEAAPAHVAAAVVSSAVPSGQTISLARGAIKMMPWAKIKVAQIVGVLLLVIGGSGAAVLNQILAAEGATPSPATSASAAESAPAVDYLKQSSGPFLEMVGCRIKQNVDLKLSPATQAGVDADWTDCQYDQVHWEIDSALAGLVADYAISVSSVDDPANVTTFHADKNSATQYLKQAMPKPGDYVVKVTADGDDGKAVAFASANVTVDPLPFTQILISDYQLDGLIHCTYILQHMNDSGQAIAGDDMDYDDTLKVTDMCDELGKPIKFTTTHRGNMFDLKYRLNNPVEPGQPFMVSNLSTIDGLSTKMLRDLGGGEYVATFKHMNGQSGAIRRIELHILPAGAKLISLMPSEIPTKVVDGRVQVFIDAMLRSGGKITSTIRYRLPDGNQKPRDSRQRCRPHFQHINSCRPMACGNSRMNCPPPFAAASYNRAASMKPDFELLQEYVGQGSRPALDQIIRRYLDLVYSAAKRQVRDPTLAQDVTQAVFLVLAKRARTIRRDRAIGGWLLAVTRCAALDAMRRQATRRKRERAAPAAQNREATGDEWAEIAPMLDAELNRLPVLDRDAVVLRYFQDQTFADIGEQLNLTPEAARKRVERAVERLRGFLARRGVTVPTAVIGGAIAAFAVQAAPSHVAAAVGAFVAPSTQSISFAQGAIKMIFWSKTKLIGAIAAILVLGGATIVLPHAWAQQAKPPTTTDAAAALAADAAAAAAAANRPPLADQTMPNAPIAFTLGNQDFVNLDVPIMFRFGFNPPSNVPPNQLAPWVKTSESIRRAVTRDAGVDLSIGETELMKLGTPSREIWPAFLLFNSAVMAPAEADLWDQPDAAILRTTLSVWEKNNGVNNSKPRGADPASYMSAMNLPAAADLPQVYVCRTSAGSLRKIRVVKIDQANKNLRVSIEIKKVAEGPEQ